MDFTDLLDRLGGVVDRWFFVSYWGPALVTAAAVACSGAAIAGEVNTYEWLADLETFDLTALGVSALFVVTLVAFLLQAAADDMIRFVSGDWPRLLSPLRRWLVFTERRDSIALHHAATTRTSRTSEVRRDWSPVYSRFPRNTDDIRPTALGNVLQAGEDYAQNMYGCVVFLWWPRLQHVLPPDATSTLQAAKAPMVGLLYLAISAALLSVFGLVGSISALASHDRWWLFLGFFVGGYAGSYAFYLGSIACARRYSGLVRIAFDLHRHALIKEIGLKLPRNAREERSMWEFLNKVLTLQLRPEFVAADPDLPNHYRRFIYESSERDTKEPE